MFKQLDAKTDEAFYNCIDTDIDSINVEIIGPTDTETQATSLLSENLGFGPPPTRRRMLHL